jgi:hypothetical protein
VRTCLPISETSASPGVSSPRRASSAWILVAMIVTVTRGPASEVLYCLVQETNQFALARAPLIEDVDELHERSLQSLALGEARTVAKV